MPPINSTSGTVFKSWQFEGISDVAPILPDLFAGGKVIVRRRIREKPALSALIDELWREFQVRLPMDLAVWQDR